MDPLSITASIIAVATVANQTCKGFAKLRALHKGVPGRLQALNNEVVDLEVVLYQVVALIEEREPFLLEPSREQEHITHLLDRATTNLEELRKILDVLTKRTTNARLSVFRGYQWQREHETLQLLQEAIKSVKCSLNIILGTSSSRDLVRVRLELNSMSLVSNQQSSEQRKVLGSLAQHVELSQKVYQNISRIAKMLEAQSERVQDGQSSQLGQLYGSVPLARRRKQSKRGSKASPPSSAQSGDVAIRVMQYAASCAPGCRCSCHKNSRSTTPAIMDRVLGRLFLGYAGLPLLSPKCSNRDCQKAQVPHVSLEYWFPLGFLWSQIIRVQGSFSQTSGPQFQIKTMRRVSDAAPCVKFALEGNMPALKDLFVRGLASPQDVSGTRGYSLLRWALYGKQYDTCQFLVHAGADMDYKPIAEHDDNPKNKACDFMLQGALSKEAERSLSCLTRLDDFVEEQNFSLLHKIVFGFSGLDLEQVLSADPDNVDVVDAMGRTALTWASARGDDQSVATLLSYHANPNVEDSHYSGPLMYAAAQSRAICVRLLLEAGADPDPAVLKKLRRGNPLNVATRLGADVLVIKNLLDFGADTESCGVEGRTSLIHAALNDDVELATIFLEYNSDINAKTLIAQTPLTTSITHNSHSVLQLLLDRWQEYSTCPRLNGPNLLQLVASYGDLETIKILTGVDHFMLSYDRDYTASDFETRLRERQNVSQEVITAFGDLLSIINERPVTEMRESLAERGLLCQDTSLDHFEDAKEYHHDDDDDDDSDDNDQRLI